MDKQLKKDIKRVVDYLWHDEKRNYEEWVDASWNQGTRDCDTHIFQTLKRIKKALDEKHKDRGCGLWRMCTPYLTGKKKCNTCFKN